MTKNQLHEIFGKNFNFPGISATTNADSIRKVSNYREFTLKNKGLSVKRFLKGRSFIWAKN